MDRTARPLLIDPAARRRAPRERLAMRWFAQATPAGTRTPVSRWGTERAAIVADLPMAA
jgi:hypothetical protein